MVRAARDVVVWPLWVVASATAALLGQTILFLLLRASFSLAVANPGLATQFTAIVFAGTLAGSLAFASIVGAAQWLVLRLLAQASAWWIPATALSGPIIAIGLTGAGSVTLARLTAEGLPALLQAAGSAVALNAVNGLLVGAAQGAALYGRSSGLRPAGVWIAASVVGWGIGWTVGAALGDNLPLFTSLALSWAAVAGVTGLALAGMLARRARRDRSSPAPL